MALAKKEEEERKKKKKKKNRRIRREREERQWSGCVRPHMAITSTYVCMYTHIQTCFYRERVFEMLTFTDGHCYNYMCVDWAFDYRSERRRGV